MKSFMKYVAFMRTRDLGITALVSIGLLLDVFVLVVRGPGPIVVPTLFLGVWWFIYLYYQYLLGKGKQG